MLFLQETLKAYQSDVNFVVVVVVANVLLQCLSRWHRWCLACEGGKFNDAEYLRVQEYFDCGLLYNNWKIFQKSFSMTIFN